MIFESVNPRTKTASIKYRYSNGAGYDLNESKLIFTFYTPITIARSAIYSNCNLTKSVIFDVISVSYFSHSEVSLSKTISHGSIHF